jgi:hypothetical protein
MFKVVIYCSLVLGVLFFSGCQDNTASQPSNENPWARNDVYSVVAGEGEHLAVLANDSDPDGELDQSGIEIISSPQHGTAVVSSEGTVVYRAEATYRGEDMFVYRVKDNEGAYSNEANVTLSVTLPNEAPVALNDTFSVWTGVARMLDILANDTDRDGTLDKGSVEILTPPAYGSVTVDDVTGMVEYRSQNGYAGEDVFRYRVKDDNGTFSNVAVVYLYIQDPNLAPIASPDSFSVVSGGEVTVNVLSNDKDPDGKLDMASLRIVKQPLHGSARVDTVNGVIIYTAEKGYSGVDTLSYQVADTEGSYSNEAVVTGTVLAVLRPVRQERSAVEWYMQLSIENLTNGQVYNGAKVGEVVTNTEASRLSLIAFDGVGYPHVNIVCKDPTGKDTTEYTVYFRAFPSDVERKSWFIEVRSSDANADMSLRWQGLYIMSVYTDEEGRVRYSTHVSLNNPLLKEMKLVDIDTKEEIAAVEDGTFQSYYFNMNGQNSRTFEWVVEENSTVSSQSVQPAHKNVPLKRKILKRTDPEPFDPYRPPFLKGVDGQL